MSQDVIEATPAARASRASGVDEATSLVGRPNRKMLHTVETRALILDAAEHEFAERGFASGRLEDIAGRVGITRAAVIYHFKDKQALYDAVLASCFGSLTERVRMAGESSAGHVERIEAVVDAWIDCSWERPTLARLFMREAADASTGFRPQVARLVEPLFARILGYIDEGSKSGAFHQLDPNHLITIVAGATTWHATSSHLLRDDEDEGEGEDTLESIRFSAYRAEILKVTRFLLGTLREENPQ